MTREEAIQKLQNTKDCVTDIDDRETLSMAIEALKSEPSGTGDLIDREKTYEVLTEYYHQRLGIQRIALREALAKVPSVKPKHGRWIYYYDNGVKRCKCSECLTSYGCIDTPFCPNCGSRNEVEE